MSLTTTATDWEFTGLAQIGLADVLGGGVYFFHFRSVIANVRELLIFTGGGIGMGGSAGGSVLPDPSTGRISYTPIDCLREFSMYDLHNSIGSVVSAGGSAAFGFGCCYIAAAELSDGPLFERQGGFGFSVGGLGLGGTAFAGLWKVASLTARTSSDEEREMMRQVERHQPR